LVADVYGLAVTVWIGNIADAANAQQALAVSAIGELDVLHQCSQPPRVQVDLQAQLGVIAISVIAGCQLHR